MANKIKLARGTKARIETVKSDLDNYEIVYATDTNELGVKNSSNEIEYFCNKTQLENNIAQVYSGKNLASPDLGGKECLGNGDYNIYNANDNITKYNIYNGLYSFNFATAPDLSSTINVTNTQIYLTAGTYTISFSNSNIPVGLSHTVRNLDGTLYDFSGARVVTFTVSNNGIYFISFYKNPNSPVSYTTTIQLEKGSTATPYTLPMVITPEYLKQTQTPRLIYSNSGTTSGTDITFSYVDSTMKVGDVYKVHSQLTYDNSELTQREVNELIISDTVNNNIEKNHYAQTQHSAITKVNYDYTTQTITMIGAFNTGDSSNSFNIRLYKVGY